MSSPADPAAPTGPAAPPPQVEVLDTANQRDLLDRFARALARRRPVAVLDPTWPAPLLGAARAQVSAAAAEGRLDGARMVVFTSGSAGTPRGVLRTQESWRRSLDPLTDLLHLTPADTVWTPGPLWSSLSLYGAWHAVGVGAGTVLAGEDPAPATVAHCVPSALDRLAAAAPPGLRAVVLAGEPVSDRHRALCAARGWRLHEYYGAAELSFVGWSADGLPWRPFPGVEVELRRGEVWVRSPYLALGTLDGRPGSLRTADGWATVGDHGTVLHGGYAVTGRGGSAISTGGHTVVAEHVEQVLLAVPRVAGAVVLGRADARLGQVVVAVLEGDPARADLRAALRRLAPAARPRRWAVVPALPRTASGKPDRAALTALLDAGTVRVGALP